jgi:hypothetical protein
MFTFNFFFLIIFSIKLSKIQNINKESQKKGHMASRLTLSLTAVFSLFLLLFSFRL